MSDPKDPNAEENQDPQTTEEVIAENPAETSAKVEAVAENQAQVEETADSKAPEESAEKEPQEEKAPAAETVQEDTTAETEPEKAEEVTEKEPQEEESETDSESSSSSILVDPTVGIDDGLASDLKRTALKTSIGKQASGTGRNWYVIHTYSGYEDAVEKALRQRIESLNMHDLIFDIIVPKENAITIKKGEHVTEKKRLFPGYVLVDMVVTDESWYVVRNTPNVTGFVGSGTIPVPVDPEEFDIIQKHIKTEEPKFKINFEKGENVIISDGPFKTYEGLIDAIDEKKGKLKVLVTIFGRETPVELDFVQVKKKE